MRIVMPMLMVASVWTTTVLADDKAPAANDDQFKELSGMSVLGNNEAPKSLVIVPWKSSEIGDGIGVVDNLSNRPMPVDKDVFAREVRYYELRTATPSDAGRADEPDFKVGSR